jgi:predicted ATPase
MGGLGRTRLVAEAACRLTPALSGGVHYVGLSAVRSEAVDSLADHIGERKLLLVLDSFEQVTAAAPGWQILLDRCPRLQALVTSQHALGIRGEMRVPAGAAAIIRRTTHPA